MAAVKEFTLPDLGEGLTDAEIVRWLVEVGEVVAVDQPVVEVETAKAVVEVPCPYEGVVTARFGAEGESLAVGRPLITVAVGSRPEEAGAEGTSGRADEGSGSVLVGYGTTIPGARRKRVRVRREWDAVPAGAVAVEPDIRPADGSGVRARDPGGSDRSNGGGPVAVASPLVRRFAREHGLDLRQLIGSGPEGLITRSDVQRAANAPGADGRGVDGPGAGLSTGDPLAADVPGRGAGRDGERIPLRGIRGAVADKVERAHREIPDATCWVDADATELLAMRREMNADGGKISVLALFARICTAALARYPDLNSTVDAERREIVRLSDVHLGFAAQTDRGLVIPVVRNAGSLTTAGLAAELGKLTEAARDGRLTPTDLTGGTFTLNNYGVFGVDGSTPIVNHPEAAMLGIGRIVAKPWVLRGELAVRQVVQLSFTFDHRVCDGGTAGGFLRFVADCVERPAVLLAAL